MIICTTDKSFLTCFNDAQDHGHKISMATMVVAIDPGIFCHRSSLIGQHYFFDDHFKMKLLAWQMRVLRSWRCCWLRRARSEFLKIFCQQKQRTKFEIDHCCWIVSYEQRKHELGGKKINCIIGAICFYR